MCKVLFDKIPSSGPFLRDNHCYLFYEYLFFLLF